MVMENAVLAVLVGADAGLTAEEIAVNYSVNEEAVTRKLKKLERRGYAHCEDGLYYATELPESTIGFRRGAGD